MVDDPAVLELAQKILAKLDAANRDYLSRRGDPADPWGRCARLHAMLDRLQRRSDPPAISVQRLRDAADLPSWRFAMTDEPNLVLRMLEQIRDRLDKQSDRLRTHDAVLDNHERVLIRMAEELGGIKGTLERMDKRLERMDARFDRVDERLDRVDEHLERLDAGQARLEATQSRTGEQLRALVGLTHELVDRQLRGPTNP